nr:MAG TPA: hypothetical protein [Caudoviricetes sp.]
MNGRGRSCAPPVSEGACSCQHPFNHFLADVLGEIAQDVVGRASAW